MAPCFLDTLFKSGWREIGLCHRCYNVPCQIQEPIFFFGTIRQIMRQLNIGHFILISQTNEGWYIWPENTSVFLSIYFCVCVRERKQINVSCVCSVLILFYLFDLYYEKIDVNLALYKEFNVLGISNNISTPSLINFIWKNTYPWDYYQCISGDVHMVLYDASFVLWFHRPHHHDHRCYCCYLCFLTRRKEAHYLWINGQQAITLMWWYSLSTCNMFICHLYSHRISAELNVNVI